MSDEYSLMFSLSNGVGPKGFQGLLREYGSAKNAWEKVSEEKYRTAGIGKVNFEKFENFKKSFNLTVYNSMLEKARVEFIPYGDKYYPVRLSVINSPPIGLFAKGNKKLLREPNIIGVVGARKITNYGHQVTENLVNALQMSNFVIASGMAMGVDAVAHNTTIEQKGKTIAVLGCGVDCAYPRENQSLYEQILDNNGLIISEYPLGMPANAGTFPARNRIIAGISGSVLITEAAEDSGSLITAEEAIKQGKTVFAVPGPIISQTSGGAIKLLKQGAVMVSSADDILAELGIPSASLRARKNKKMPDNLSKDEKSVYKCIENDEKTVDEISKETKLTANQLSIILSYLELCGIVRNSNGKFSL